MLIRDIYNYLPVTYDVFGYHPMLATNSKVGLEIELEGIRNSNREAPNRSWTVIPDGSLRDNGIEYVTRGDGIAGVVLYEAITALDEVMKDINPSTSWRCSTHVHVDIRDLTAKQLKHLILIYLVFERFLFRCSGWNRYKNNFCIALGIGQGLLNTLGNCWGLSDITFLNNVTTSWNKYTAMNLCTVARLGTVEFRISEAKWRSGHLIKLINRFLSIKKLAKEWEGSEADLIMHCIENNKEIFIKGISRGVEIEECDLEIGAKLAFDILNKAKIDRRNKEKIKNILMNTSIRIMPEMVSSQITAEEVENNDLPEDMANEDYSNEYLLFPDCQIIASILDTNNFIHDESIEDYEYCCNIQLNNSEF